MRQNDRKHKKLENETEEKAKGGTTTERRAQKRLGQYGLQEGSTNPSDDAGVADVHNRSWDVRRTGRRGTNGMGAAISQPDIHKFPALTSVEARVLTP